MPPNGQSSNEIVSEAVSKATSANKFDNFAVRELLTDYNYQLYIETKTALKEKYKYIWTKNGRIYVKKEAG